MASKSADNAIVPPELDPDSGCPLLSRPAPLPEQAHSQPLSRATAASRRHWEAIGWVLRDAGNIDPEVPVDCCSKDANKFRHSGRCPPQSRRFYACCPPARTLEYSA